MKRDAVMELAKQCAVGELCDKKVFSRLAALEKLAARVKKLEQYHCEHEFSNTAKGCLESIFCSKCGALHPDWVQTFQHLFGFADGEKPVGYLITNGKHYRTVASKPKDQKK